jgi:enoyl-CoA hydratase/carnithine racemase
MELLGQGAVTELEHVVVRREPPAARITLNRPEKRNALSLELMREVVGVLRELGADREVRAIVFEGAGPAFSGGHDLAEMVGRDLPFYQELFDVCTEMMEAIHQVPQPVIAKVHGIATAAGCQLVATCDLAVASEDARFGTSGVKTGLFCTTPGVAVSRTVGRKQALEMLLTGELIDARTALEWGLLNRVVPTEALEDAVSELVEAVSRLSPLAIAVGKQAFYRQIELDEHRAYDIAKTVMTMNSLAEDAQEGFCAFLERRPATWKGK